MFIDEEGEATIRGIWENVCDAGISSFMPDTGVRPHITLAVYDQLDIDLFLEKFSEFSRELSPISFSLSSIGAFLEPRGTVFIAPTVTHRLMNLHAKFHQEFHDLEHSLSEYSLPGKWLPHFTLASELSDDQIKEVICIGLNAPVPAHSTLTEIGIGEFSYELDSRAYQVSWIFSVPIV